jgi:hypothetical protein
MCVYMWLYVMLYIIYIREILYCYYIVIVVIPPLFRGLFLYVIIMFIIIKQND